MIEPCKRPIMFELMHTAELTYWQGDPNDSAWRTFLGDVRQFVKKEGAAPLSAVIPTIASTPRQFGVRTLIGVIALLAVGASVFWLANRAPKVAPKPLEAVTATTSGVMREVTLAVLPFADMSKARDQEYYSDGLTEEILNQLAQIKNLRVTGRTSSFSFKGKNEDLRVIAKKLGVANLLEGSIRKNGKTLRITAQLINGMDGAHLWSQTYDREPKDVFAVQEEIAKDVAKALSIKLDVGNMPRAQGGTTNLEAYDKYLHGRVLFGRFGNAAVRQSTQYYREAVALDRTFERAWSDLYIALRVAQVFDPANTVALRKELDEVGARIETMNPDAWWTQAALGAKYRSQYKWAKAEEAGKAALATAPPSEAEAVGGFAVLMSSVGRANEAVTYWQRASQADPLAANISDNLVRALEAAGRSAEAQMERERAKELARDPIDRDAAELTRVWFQKNVDPTMVEARLRHYQEAYPGNVSHTLLAYLVGKVGDHQAARAALHKAFDDPANQNGRVMSTLAGYADFYGDRDLALAALRRAHVDMHYFVIPALWTTGEPGLHTDPKFKQIVRDMGLVDYWRSSGNWGDFCTPVGKDDFECH
jgi:TolB-like protein/Tfp pilus assembly protein PilF